MREKNIRILVFTRAREFYDVILFRHVCMHGCVLVSACVYDHYGVIIVSAQARRGQLLQQSPLPVFLLAMDTDDDMGLEEQVEQEERARILPVQNEQDEALRQHSVFNDGVGTPAEPCANTYLSSPFKPLQNPSSASASQSPSPVSTPVSTASSSNRKRKAECDSCAEEQPFRKRLRGKQPCPELPTTQEETATTPLHEVDPFWQDFMTPDLENLQPTTRYNRCYYKLRSWLYANRYDFDKMCKKRGVLGSCLVKATTSWRNLPKWSKRVVVAHFLEETNAPASVVSLFRETWPDSDKHKENSQLSTIFRQHGKSILCTYIGDWGLLPDIEGVVNINGALVPWKQVVNVLCKRKQVEHLWEEFVALCKSAASYLGDLSWTCCFELCMSSYIEERKLRVHGHLFLRRRDSRIDFTAMEEVLTFHGVPPFCSEYLCKQSRSCSASWQGAFYCQCPKIGQLFSAGNVVPFKGYPVNGDWVFTLVQQEKIEYDDAKEWIIRSGRAVGRRLQDLAAWRQARAELQSRAYVQAAQVAHAAANLAWREIKIIEKWKEENTQPLMRRKKFLVLAGRTGVGKTEYVKALFGAEHTLELNAAGMLHPCLRQFDVEKHRCILWDEAEALLIAQNRKLFQCPSCFVELGFSPTGAMTYSVMVNQAVMVVNSNRWDEQLSLLEKGDRDWILGNAVVVHVDEPLWVMLPKSREGDDAQDPADVVLTPTSSRQSPLPDSADSGISSSSGLGLVFV